jgi:hypothetical protein
MSRIVIVLYTYRSYCPHLTELDLSQTNGNEQGKFEGVAKFYSVIPGSNAVGKIDDPKEANTIFCSIYIYKNECMSRMRSCTIHLIAMKLR